MGNLVNNELTEFQTGNLIWRRIGLHSYQALDINVGKATREEGSSMMRYYYRNFPMNMAISEPWDHDYVLPER